MTPNETIRHFYQDELGWCNCGRPEDALDLMRDVLAALNSLQNDGNFDQVHKTLSRWLGEENHKGLYWSYFYTLDAAGLLEHGGNVSGSWLTPKGLEILGALQSFDLETVFDEELGPTG